MGLSRGGAARQFVLQTAQDIKWFSGNIGSHHIHHLTPRIPNYNLERCHQAEPLFQTVPPVTLFSSLKSLTFRLWDEERHRLIGFSHSKISGRVTYNPCQKNRQPRLAGDMSAQSNAPGDEPLTVLPGKLQRIGIAADHGGYELKEYLAGKLRAAGYEVVDFGDGRRKRTMTIRILSCRWPARSPPKRWIAAWASVAVGSEHRSARTKWRAFAPA